MNEHVAQDDAPTSTSPAISKNVFISLFVAAIVIAIIGGVVVSATERTFYPPDHNQLEDPPEYVAAVKSSMMKNYGIGFGVFGAILLGAVGAICGATKGAPAAVVGGICGTLVGGAIAAAAAAYGYKTQSELYISDMDGMLKTPLVVGALYATCGIVGGILAGLFGKTESLGAGLGKGIGSGIGMTLSFLVIYIVVALLVFPVGNTDSVFAEHRGTAYTSMICMSLAAAAAAFLALRAPKPKAAADA